MRVPRVDALPILKGVSFHRYTCSQLSSSGSKMQAVLPQDTVGKWSCLYRLSRFEPVGKVVMM